MNTVPTYQQYEEEFVSFLIDATSETASAPGMLPALQALLDALPYYGDPDFESTHRGTLSALLQINLANNAIAAQPPEFGTGFAISYFYEGNFPGYADAFFPSRAATAATTAVATGVAAQNAQLNAGWWQSYSLAVLTDAAQQAATLSLDTAKLATDLET